MATKRGLGRNFDSLIPMGMLDEQFDPSAEQDEQVSQLRNLRLTDIQPDPDQPRRHFEEEYLLELSQSLKQHGLLQPIVVTPSASGKYQIVAGERRYRAAIMAKLEKIPAIIRTLSDQHKLEVSLIENIQRRDLNPLETATAYLKLHQQFNLSYDEIGARVGGKAGSTVSNVLRLLQLPETAKQALIKAEITEGHARQILAIDDTKIQNQLLNYIITEGWSVRKTEQFVVGYKLGSDDSKAKTAIHKTKTESVHTKKIGKRLGTDVRLKTTAKGGQLIIDYKNDADLDRISNMLLKN